MEAPRGEDARDIVAHYLSKSRIGLAFDAAEVASALEGHSCAFLETVVNEATLTALYDRADTITISHFIDAFVRCECGETLAALPDEFPVTTRTADSASERAQVAIHEAGHVAAIEALSPHTTTVAFLCGQPGSMKGITRDTGSVIQGSFDSLAKSLIIALAGETATELVLGIPTTGAASDREKAFSIASSLLTDGATFGMRYVGPERYE